MTFVVTAHQYHRPTGNGPRSIVAGVRNLGFVPDVNPAPAEKARALLAEAFRIDKRAPIYAELSRCLIVDYVPGVRFLHDESPRDTPSAAFGFSDDGSDAVLLISIGSPRSTSGKSEGVKTRFTDSRVRH